MKFPRYILLALAAVVLISGCGKSTSPTRVTPDTPTMDNASPPVPEGLAVSEDPVSAKSTMTWSPSTAPDVVAYDILIYSPDPSREESYALLYTTDGPATSYGLDPTADVTTKYFRVRAVDADGNHSALSAAIAATVWPARQPSHDPDQPPPSPRMDP